MVPRYSGYYGTGRVMCVSGSWWMRYVCERDITMSECKHMYIYAGQVCVCVCVCE